MTEKILIVDDDIDSLKLIGLMLQRHGYEVLAANAGAQALAKADAEVPSLIILDVMMPDMNGLEVCRRLRANPKTDKIPIIMFTAKTLIDDKVKGFEAGADDYLTKPTHPAELASRVKAILARNAAKQPQDEASPARRGTAIGVMGAKGGVGTTSVAVNIAAALMQANENPVIADFRLGNGSMGLALGSGRSQGMARVLAKSANDVTAKMIEADFAHHQSGLRMLLSTASPRESQLEYNPDTVQAVVTQLRTLGNPAIVDLGAGINPRFTTMLPDLDKLILVVEPNGVTLKMAQALIEELENIMGGGRISVVVLNRAQSSLQTPWHEVENILGREVKAIISAAPELAFQAMESNVPMVILQPNAIVSTQFIKLADELKSGIRTIPGRQQPIR